MKIPRRTCALLAGVALVAGTLATAGAVTAAPGGSTSPPIPVTDRGPEPVPAARTTAPSTATVTLVTGDRFRVDSAADGAQHVTPLAANGTPDTARAATFTQFSWHDDTYVVPNSAVPYLASALDIRLFDLSYLVRANLDDAHSATLPVTLSSRDGSALPALSAARGPASLSKKRAGLLGTMLAIRWRAARSAATTGTLPGGGKVSLVRPAGAPALPVAPKRLGAAKPATGGLPFHTLTFNPVDREGRPATSMGFIQNVDDASLGGFVVAFPGTEGPVSFSVAEGTYSAEFAVLGGPASDLTIESSLVVKPEFAVTGDTTVEMDARAAKPFRSTLAAAPTDADRLDILTFNRTSVAGGSFGVSAYGLAFTLIAMHLASMPAIGNPVLYATPTPSVRKGSFDFAALTELVGAEAGTNPDPRYYLMFPHHGSIPNSLTYHIPASALTTVRSRIYDDTCGACTRPRALFQLVYLPWGLAELGWGSSVPSGERTDYRYSSAPDLTVWQSAFNANDGSRRWGPRRTIRPGRTLREEWNRGPAVPAPAPVYTQNPTASITGAGAVVDKASDVVCGACRQDDNAMVFLQGLADADPAHYADALWSAGQSRVLFSRNGKLAFTSDSLSTGTMEPSALPLPMLATAATYRLDWSYAGLVNTGQAVDTSWTFRSSPHDRRAALPAAESCLPDTSRHCSFLPLLYLTYDLPLTIASQAAAGAPYTFGFTVAGQAHSPQRGSAATVSVSYDDGATWTTAQRARRHGRGRFTATVNHPDLADTNGFVALRITARDAKGNTVTQKIIRAYGLS